jgi:hypothetical protein
MDKRVWEKQVKKEEEIVKDKIESKDAAVTVTSGTHYILIGS